VKLQPGERLDKLLIGDLQIIQHEEEFCFSLDAVLLAHFATLRPGGTAIDLGAGTGVLGLLLIALGAMRVTGVEINARMAKIATRTALFNNLAERLVILQGDVREIRSLLPGGGWSLVVANPPYRPKGGGFVNAQDQVAMARHEMAGTLSDFITAASYLVKYRGRFALVHLPERMAEILTAMSQAGLEPKRLQLVYPSFGKKPKFLLVEGVRGAKPGLDVLAPLYVYDKDGNYSQEILSYYQG
jgi:tRNA1(Val) A37 N6-methylase TrmN6